MTSARWDARQLGSQTGRTFLVTGANSGIGLESSRELVRRGAHVLLAVRDTGRGERARQELAGLGAQGRSTVVALDLADLDDVAAAAKRVADEHGGLHGLVCNAGVMGGPLELTSQGHERQMGINHLGHAALVSALWPQLRSAAGRVVLVSSLAARSGTISASSTLDDLVAPVPYRPQAVYANSKQANLLFAQELHRRAAASGAPVGVVAAHPGVSATNLFTRQLRESGLSLLAPVADAVLRLALMAPEGGALPVLRALESSTPSGAFVGPAGLGQTRGRPELLEIYPPGRDPAAAGRLWELTEQLLERPLL